MRTLLLHGLLAWLLVLVAPVATSCSEPAEPLPRHVGAATCAACHDLQHARWTGSHHDLAMQEATPQTVLGDFDDRSFTYHGVESTFHVDGEQHVVRTDGPDGALTDYPVKYVFGVEPLQQYLVEFPGGRLQALPLCWDTRPAEEGGQRWFHLYQGENITHDDPLHWTGRRQTWNHQCASCHSTDLRRGYDAARDEYDTTWSELDVGCEACHGPGSRHVEWARAGEPWPREDKGLTAPLTRTGAWVFEPGASIATRVPAADRHPQVDSCAPCHARRSMVHEEPALGSSFLDTHRPATLEERLYHPDGQIEDEVYVWGSFVQSKMYHKGVTCSDCHDPHSLDLKAPGDALCTQCHLASTYQAAAHHFHEPDSAGARCVECHMPSRTYMVIDPRRDHSFRVPRPDLSAKLGTPNACNSCHDDQTAEWAAEAISGWYPDSVRPAHFGETLHAAHTNGAGSAPLLADLAGDGEQPGIARATALELMGSLGGATPDALRRCLQDQDPLVRRAAVTALQSAPPTQAIELAQAALSDPVRSVRMEAARLITTTRPLLQPGVQDGTDEEALAAALAEYTRALELNSDQPWAHVNSALLHLAAGQADLARDAYLQALKIEPGSVEAAANLADLYREQERDDLAEGVLRSSLKRTPTSAELSHSLGLLLVRTGRLPEALHFLARAADERPENPRFGYVHGVALHESGNAAGAIAALERAHERHPHSPEILQALIAYLRGSGDEARARDHEATLRALNNRD